MALEVISCAGCTRRIPCSEAHPQAKEEWMSRSSRRKQRCEAKRILGIPLTWEDELPPKSDEVPEAEVQDDGFFNASSLRPYLPETRVEDHESGA